MSRFQALADDLSESEHSETITVSGIDLINLRERRQDEIEAVRAIYDDDAAFEEQEQSTGKSRVLVRLRVTAEVSAGASPALGCTLVILLGIDYPASTPLSIKIEEWDSDDDKDVRGPLLDELLRAAQNLKGEEQLQELFDVARTFLTARAPRDLYGTMQNRLLETAAVEQAERQLEQSQLAEQLLVEQKEAEERWASELKRELEMEEEHKRRALVKRRTVTASPDGSTGGDREDGDDDEDEEEEDDDPPLSADAAGSRFLSEYRFLKQLGAGGGGKVVKVRNRLDRRLCKFNLLNMCQTSAL